MARQINAEALAQRLAARKLSSAQRRKIERQLSSATKKNAVKKRMPELKPKLHDMHRSNKKNKQKLQKLNISSSHHPQRFKTDDEGMQNPSSMMDADVDSFPSYHQHFQINPLNPARFDVPGCADVNELVKYHHPATARKKLSTRPSFAHKPIRNTLQQDKASQDAHASISGWSFNFAKFFVHPLHNFLQAHFGLDNGDEIQLMVMPRTASSPVLLDSFPVLSNNDHHTTTATMLHDVYFASNSERITQDALNSCTQNWKLLSVYKIRPPLRVVHGEAGRHAEQKLLEYLPLIGRRYGIKEHRIAQHHDMNKLASAACNASNPFTATHAGAPPRHRTQHQVVSASDAEKKKHESGTTRRALIIGERLPCVACRIFAVQYEEIAEVFPSHGHLYLSTIPFTPGFASIPPARVAELIRTRFIRQQTTTSQRKKTITGRK